MDYDSDGWLDIFLTNGRAHPDALYRNNGDGSFTDVANSAGVASSMQRVAVIGRRMGHATVGFRRHPRKRWHAAQELLGARVPTAVRGTRKGRAGRAAPRRGCGR